MKRRPLLLAAALPLALLSGCSSGGAFPSLARRPAERISGTASPVQAAPSPAAVSIPASADLATRLAGLVSQARDAHDRFAARQPEADRLSAAASGAAVASEAWSVATVSLASLESARSDAMIALASLDALHAGERVANYNAVTADAAAIAAARDQVMRWVAEEDAVLAALRGRLRS